MHLSGSRLLYRLFTSGFETGEQLLIRRLILLNAFLIIGSFAFSTFTLVNLFVNGNTAVALLDAAAAALFVGSFIDLRRNKRIGRTIFIGSTTLILFMLFFVALNHNRDFGMIWTIFVPIFVISLYGYRTGLLIALLYYFALSILAINGLETWRDDGWNRVAVIRFIVASGVLVFVVFITEYAFDKLQRTLNALSVTDPLTQLFNRRKIDDVLNMEIDEGTRYGTSLSLAILDIDNFKAVNDTHGHIVGDAVLCEVAGILRRNVRRVDTAGRWGGEEFLVILPKTSAEEAAKSIERLAEAIREHEFPGVGRLSCSFGLCSTVPGVDFNKRRFVTCADNALYSAKKGGRDRIVACSV